MTEIQELEIGAVYNASRGDFDEAIKMARRAAELEEATPPPMGPPTAIKPAHELFGEVLLRARRSKEAAEQFATSLRRHKNRARSLLGAARGAAQSGDMQSAAKAYAQFSQQWRQGDAQAPELREALDYLKRPAGG
jgi:tetratricopeptide (TPR) repeat protein